MRILSGTTYLRPIRLGFVASGFTPQLVSEAARLASGVWGGVYFPMFDAAHPDLLPLADALSIDVLHPLDDASATTALADLPGFQWKGREQWGPFGGSEGSIREGLLPIDQLLDHRRSDWSLTWSEDDLGALYDVWFGSAAPSDERPSASPAIGDLGGGSDPFLASPAASTAEHVDYTGQHEGAVVVVIGPKVEDLVRFWNIRATGSLVLPWLVADPEGSANVLHAWLRCDHVVGHAHKSRRGDGVDLGPVIYVSGRGQDEEAQAVHAAIEQFGFIAGYDHGISGGWRGNHPLGTSFDRSFSIELSKDSVSLDLPLPELPLTGGSAVWPGTVAADIVVHRESQPPDGRTLTVPAVRRLAPCIDRSTRDPVRFCRPTGEGQAVGVQGGASTVTVGLVPAMEIYAHLLPSGAQVDQSDDGRFVTQFVDRLGGPTSVAASQPAVRQVLYDLANADRSTPIARLINAAVNARGAWPDLLSRQTPREYANSVVYSLTHTGLVLPTASVRCPRCATETDVRPDELAAEMRCVVCRDDLNLGLALALQGAKNPWRYRLAAHLPPSRVRSGLATMAANTVLRTAHRAGSAPTIPHVFGLTVRLDGWSCEVDLAALIPDGALTVAVVGEVKGGRELIDSIDVANLQRVQGLLRDAGLETFILAATTRGTFDATEIAILRAACEAAPRRISSRDHGLALPIVLTAPDMSTPWFDDAHPWRWGDVGDAPLNGLASVGCHRNLGLAKDGPRWVHAEGAWAFDWD